MKCVFLVKVRTDMILESEKSLLTIKTVCPCRTKQLSEIKEPEDAATYSDSESEFKI